MIANSTVVEVVEWVLSNLMLECTINRIYVVADDQMMFEFDIRI